MIFKKSITARFMATVIVVLLIAQSSVAVIFLLNSRSVLLASLESRMKRAAAMIAFASSKPLIIQDYALIDTYINKFFDDEEITSIHIIDSDRQVVMEKIKAEDDTVKTINPFLYKKPMSEKSPVIVDGIEQGEVVIDYSAGKINESIKRIMIITTIYQGIILIAVAVIMTFLFYRNIKVPVLRINRAIESISNGDLTVDIPDMRDQDIGSIARGITFLEEKLTMMISKFNSTTVNISMAVKQVEVMYNNIIDGVTKQSNAVKDAIKSAQEASKAQSEITVNTEKLSNFSSENVSSLLEMKATAAEIASNNQRLYKATEDTHSAVMQLTRAAKVVTENSNEGVASIEDTSASVKEVGASIKEVDDHAKDSAKMAEKVREITSDVGMLAIVNAVEGMDKIANEVKNSADIIEQLGKRSTKIEKVLSVIKDVTEQTNLLSLNAAILAAQAGEYGKSFSVVANEISALSQRTASSTREIGGIVKTIQKDIKDAVRSIDSAKGIVDEGNALVYKVGDVLKEILTASEHSSDMTGAIERATKEQTHGLSQITAAIDEVRGIIKVIARSTGEQQNALEYLLEGSGEIKEVADISKRGTEEQALGTGVISKNLEDANDKITQISHANMNQMKYKDDIFAAMSHINKLGMSTKKDIEEVSRSLSTLFEEIAILKKDMGVFKIR
jgi:methyl-accepting chemotaxis protein